MLKRIALALVVALSVPSAANAQDWDAIRAQWNKPTEPFRIIDNIYYVGTAGLSVYLITDPKGHILIDGALAESVPQIAANIEKLGFNLRDVKVMMVNHAHWDHSGGLAELKRLTGARLLASAADKPGLEAGTLDYRPPTPRHAPIVKVDGLLEEGTQVRVGDTVITAHMTPGHTKGCTSWSMRVGGRNVVFAGSMTVAGQPLKKGEGYDNAVSDFRATFAKLRAMPADIFLSFHGEVFNMEAKRARLLTGDANAFVDPDEIKRRVDAAEAAFEVDLAKQLSQ
ncbi:MAG: subclass B3 metallo-beta-lactamase [Sphingomonadales bacterium]|nr:MAG: subclass B3 metallo-beta-lactamase [Sphingomonadales bacterium]